MFTVKPNFGRAANIWLENRQKQNVTEYFFRKRKVESNTWGKNKYKIICQCANIAGLQKIHMFSKSIF